MGLRRSSRDWLQDCKKWSIFLTISYADADPAAFRAAMRELAGGVCVVTSGQGDHRTGLTATSITSLSLEPPTLIACINRQSSTAPVLQQSRSFAINVLGAHQRDIAARFSGKDGLKGADRYAQADWISLATGTPVLADALAAFDCEVEELIERHSHLIVIGRVQALHKKGGSAPLVYWNGDYRMISKD